MDDVETGTWHLQTVLNHHFCSPTSCKQSPSRTASIMLDTMWTESLSIVLATGRPEGSCRGSFSAQAGSSGG